MQLLLLLCCGKHGSSCKVLKQCRNLDLVSCRGNKLNVLSLLRTNRKFAANVSLKHTSSTSMESLSGMSGSQNKKELLKRFSDGVQVGGNIHKD